ncbi:MAG: toll/interleukin-1 receptor domain-containing protein [Planctomycetota bacterium]
MFVVVQLPFFDPAFVRGPGLGHPKVPWPPEDPDREPVPFLFGSGAAMSRHGAPPEDIEASCYDAHRALRLRPADLRIEGGRGYAAVQADCRFRRVFGQGNWDYRLEVGFSVRPVRRRTSGGAAGEPESPEAAEAKPQRRRPPSHRLRKPRLAATSREWDPDEVFRIVRALLRLPATVGPQVELGWADRATAPLHTLGPALAELLTEALTPVSERGAGDPVRAGQPLIYIECSLDESDSAMRSFRPVDLGRSLEHRPLLRRGLVRLGKRGRGPSFEAFLVDGRADAVLRRNLRLCLLRTHAMFWSLSQLLEDLSAGRLAHEPRTPAGARLERCFDDLTATLKKGLFYGFETAELQRSFAALWPEHRETVEETLERWSGSVAHGLAGARRSTRQGLERWLGAIARLFRRSVFLSYSHDDAEPVEALEQALERSGVTVWRDVHHLATGSRLGTSLERAIHAQDCLIVCCTPSSLESEHVRAELRYAQAREAWVRRYREPQARLVLPVLLDGAWETWQDRFPPEVVAAQATGWRDDPGVLARTGSTLAAELERRD